MFEHVSPLIPQFLWFNTPLYQHLIQFDVQRTMIDELKKKIEGFGCGPEGVSKTARAQDDPADFDPEGGRTRTDKIGVGAGTDIVFPTSKTQVCRTHRPTKSLSVPARRSVS